MKYFSKSQFTRGLQCHKSLYLYRERRDLQDTVSPAQQAIFDAGTEVGVLAHQWIKNGVLIKADHLHPQDALEETKAAILAGAKVLYEAAFLHDDVLIRADILAKNPEGNWDLFEVKSTTDVEDSHLDDVAIQRYVLAGAGVTIGVAHIVHLDPAYVRSGALDLAKLFKAVDVTKETEARLDVLPDQLKRMKTMAADTAPPVRAIGPHCTKPHDCSFIGHCWAHVPDYSVFNLAGARMDKKTLLWNSGYKTIPEIPKTEKLTAYQTIQRAVATANESHVDQMGIMDHLKGLSYPIYGLDFEAVNLAVPPYDGLRPDQQLAFEASVHVRRERGAPLEHFEFLGDGTKDPRRDLINFLLDTIKSKGSVMAYHSSYEGGIIKSLAGLVGRSAAELLDIETRLWDLAVPFKKALWAEPAFEGSWSIKKVLPVLVPDMTYKGLAIAEGTAAMRAYARLMDPTCGDAERAQIMDELSEYCATDTLAMFKILDRIEQVVGVCA